MSLAPRALFIASVIGTVLQTAMVVAGHSNRSIAKLFAVGGMSFSLVAGVIYAMLARADGTASAVVGGVVAGAICALGTLSSAVTGAIGGCSARSSPNNPAPNQSCHS